MLVSFFVCVFHHVDIRASMAHADVEPLDSDDLKPFTVLGRGVPDVL